MYQDVFLHNGYPAGIVNLQNYSPELFFTNIQNVIEKAKNGITSLTKNTEEDFLSIGQSFQNYYKSAKDITEITAGITETISNQILKNGINQLNVLLLKLSDYFASSSSNLEGGESSLSEILSVLSSVIEDLSGFKRIVKHLRMLGISTRIESARLNHDDADFSTLAENVEKLSAIINDKAAAIRERAVQLIGIIKETISRVILLENKQREQIAITLNSINNNLDELNKKYNLCSTKTEIITDKSSEIYQNISQIVSSIQFHDITRQQMEHVAQALNLLLAKQLAGEGQLHDNFQNNAVYVHNLCRLQSLQLKHTKEELSKAVNSIISSLNNVRYNVADVYSEAKTVLTDNKETESSNTIKDIEAGFSEISASLDKDSGIRFELISSMKSVSDTIRGLALHINEIEEIGSEIELIALNSSIKAARTGTEGAALGVLAESIQRLSNESKNQTRLVSETLRRISDSAEKLYKSIEFNSGDKNSIGLKQLASEISSQLDSLSILDKNTFKQLLNVKDVLENLDNAIISSVSKITVHQKTSEIIDHITKELDKIVYNISRIIAPEFLNKEEDLQELNYKYTMNSERNIHNNFVNSKKLKMENSSGIEVASADGNHNFSEDFGDNVELF